MRNLKQSTEQYRNIQGVKYLHYTSDPAEFQNCKKECKEQGLRYRIIDHQFYKESK